MLKRSEAIMHLYDLRKHLDEALAKLEEEPVREEWNQETESMDYLDYGEDGMSPEQELMYHNAIAHVQEATSPPPETPAPSTGSPRAGRKRST